MDRDTLNEIRQERIEIMDELADLEDLYEMDQRDGVTIDDSELASAQQNIKESVSRVLALANNLVDETGEYEVRDGEVINLPDGPLERTQEISVPELPDIEEQ